MRFFKTHGFVKPLLREMLFLVLVIFLVFTAFIFVGPSRDKENPGHVVPVNTS